MNPEPMHAFIDAFVIGEGEEVIHDIIDVVQIEDAKRAGDVSINRNVCARWRKFPAFTSPGSTK